MKKSLVLAMAMALGVTASAYAANPFSDVPAGHWAYDAVTELADAGIIDGYPNGTFGGNKLMTRYEMAQIVAKAMAKGANVDALAAEFADELESLGVRVANLEEKADNVKVTGEIRYSYSDDRKDFKDYENKLRSRIWVNGQVNDEWTYTGMLENTQNFKNDTADEKTNFQRAYVNGKIGGMAVQTGRYNLTLAEGNVYDNRFDGVQASYGQNIKLIAGYGKATPSIVNFRNNGHDGIKCESDEVYYAELKGKLGGLGLTAAYYDFNDISAYAAKDGVADGKAKVSDDMDIWAFSANYAFDNNIKLGAMYLLGNDEYANEKNLDHNGYVFTAAYKGAKAAEAGSWGLNAKYYNQGETTYLNHTMNGKANDMFGFKGYSVAANYTFAKNIVGQVEWYDLQEKEGNRDAQTLWSQVVFTF